MKLLGCGSRTWTDYKSARREIAALQPDEVIHGGAKGADSIIANEAVEWATYEGRGLIVTPFLPDWSIGKSAGIRRNADMLRLGKPDRGLALGAIYKWDTTYGGPGRWITTGTGDMAQRMLRVGLPVRWVPAPGAAAQDLTAMPPPPVAT